MRVGLKFGAGEGIRILDPLKACLMRYQKSKKYIANGFYNLKVELKFGAGEGIRIYHSLQLTHVIQQILRKLY